MDEIAKAINHFSVLMENQNAKLDAVLEHLDNVPKIQDFRRIENTVDNIDRRLGAVEAVLKSSDREIVGLDQRVTRLEAA